MWISRNTRDVRMFPPELMFFTQSPRQAYISAFRRSAPGVPVNADRCRVHPLENGGRREGFLAL